MPNLDPPLPKGWRNQTVFTFMGPNVDSVPHIVTVIRDTSGRKLTLDEFSNEHVALLRAGQPNMSVARERRVAAAKDLVTRELLVGESGQGPANRPYRLLRFAIVDRVGYVFSCQVTRRSLKLVGRDIDSLIDSVLVDIVEESEE